MIKFCGSTLTSLASFLQLYFHKSIGTLGMLLILLHISKVCQVFLVFIPGFGDGLYSG